MSSKLSVFQVLLMTIFLIAGPQAWAAKEKSYIEECRQVAIEKLALQAASYDSTLLPETLEVTGVDDRWYNPIKYVWFDATAVRMDGVEIHLKLLTQKSFLPPRKCGP